VVTIYYGSGITLNEAESVAEGVRKRYPNLQVDVVYGGQPYYHYIASIE
jgi:dihydroxyacetone kinase-like predicted kinase